MAQDCRLKLSARHGVSVEEIDEVMQEFYENPAVWNKDGSLNKQKAIGNLEARVKEQKIFNRIEQKQMSENQQKLVAAFDYIENFRTEYKGSGIKPKKDPGYKEAIRSLLVGSATYKPIKGSTFSVDSRYNAMATNYMSDLQVKLEERPHVIPLLGGDSGTVFKERTLRGEALKKAQQLYQVDNIQDARIAFNDDVIREVYGIRTGNDDAKFAANIISETFELSRADLNARGATIGKIEHYVPQNHAAETMIEAGKAKWVKDIMPKLDMDKTFPDIMNLRRAELRSAGDWEALTTGKGLFTEEMKIDIYTRLEDTYDAIITGSHKKATQHTANHPSMYTGKRISKKFEGDRALHFNGAENFIAYKNEYGRNELLSSVEQHLDSAARAGAMMDVMGSNPEVFLQDLLNEARDRIKKDARLTPEQKSKLAGDLRGDVAKRDFNAIINDYKEISGETREAVDVNMAKLGKGIRNVEAMSKLGGAALSALSDTGVYAQQSRIISGEFKSIHNVLADIHRAGTPESKEILDQMGVVADGMSQGMVQRFNGADIEGATGVTSRMVNTLFKITGLTQWTENVKRAFALSLGNEIGKASTKAFDDIHVGLRNSLVRGGFDETKWNVLRTATEKGADGRLYVTPAKIKTLSNKAIDPILPEKYREAGKPTDRELARLAGETDEAYSKRVKRETVKEIKRWKDERIVARDKARKELEIQYRSYLIEETHNAVLEPTARTRSALLQGTKAGTYSGEAMRLFTQFKSFPLMFTQRVLGVGRGGLQGGLLFTHGQSKWRNASGVVQTAFELTALGYISMTAKDFVKGKTPKDPLKSNTIMQAMLQGGGLGLIGDFMFSDINKYGKDVVETLSGPAIGDAIHLLKAGVGLSRGEFEDAWRNTRSVIRGNLPYSSVWWATGAFNHLFLYQVEEMLAPGTMRRREQRLKQDYGQEFFVR